MFDRFVGNWEVRIIPENEPACKFWRRIISDYTGQEAVARVEYFEHYKADLVAHRFPSKGSINQ